MYKKYSQKLYSLSGTSGFVMRLYFIQSFFQILFDVLSFVKIINSFFPAFVFRIFKEV